MKKIAIIDYNMGNLHSISKALEFISTSFTIEVTNNKDVISDARAIILPGVGAFGKGMENLIKFGLVEILKERINKGIPFLGICLGLQLLFSKSQEHGEFEGLDVIKGEVVKFPQGLKVPHMGWNQIKIKNPFKINPEERQKSEIKIFKDIPDNSYFYFVHSYYVNPEDKDWILATTEYSVDFPSVIKRDNIIGVQFHPEKSQILGLKFLENFIQLVF